MRSWLSVRDRQTCVGCGKKSPETETNYTLISAQFGWRLTRYKSADGALIVEWRCPTCWRDYKRARTTPVEEASDSRPSQPPMVQPSAPRSTLPKPPTPFESFRPRSPSNPDANGLRRSPPPPPLPAARRSAPPAPAGSVPPRPPPRPPPRGTR
ncbi:MAG TPA: hypothetical protein VHS09_08945 [Polyangiaceae bacterium]|nr:hypothetical protein [Polyangiaceae bacterium]